MTWLWQMITDTTERTGTIAAGDSACGFGNTAMMLAEKRYIPRVWAAVIRVMTVARSLVAYEQGAVAPARTARTRTGTLRRLPVIPCPEKERKRLVLTCRRLAISPRRRPTCGATNRCRI